MAGESFVNLTIESFLGQLGSERPTPGGGAVAALCGALAAGLGQMACALTIGKPQYTASEPRVREIAGRLKRAGLLLTMLIDEDAEAYQQLSAAFKLPKEQADRKQRIAAAASVAATVPLQVLAAARKVRLDLARLPTAINPKLASDVECGLHIANAAMHSSAVMVRTNLPYIDARLAAPIRQELDALLADPPRPGE